MSERPALSGTVCPDRPSAVDLVERWRGRGEVVVFTNGCFDLLHVGHVTYLAQARALGARLVVGVNDDASVRRLKGPSRPIQTVDDRAILLAALRSVDLVVAFAEDTPLELILALRPEVLVKGGDYAPGEIVGADEVAGWGGRVAILPFVPGRSTSRIAASLANRGSSR